MYKEIIINKLGSSHKNPIVPLAHVKDGDPYALYTYKNDVYTFIDGMDIPFDDLTEEQQFELANIVDSGEYKIDKTIQ